MSERISLDKHYTTRDGREVRIYAVDGKGKYTAHGAVKRAGGWESATWTYDGHYSAIEPDCDWNLIEVRPRHKWAVWLNFYSDGNVYAATEIPNLGAAMARKRIEVDFTEGEFDE